MKTIAELSALLGQTLKQQGLKVTCAESCTGGGIAHAITDSEGSSGWFDAGFVTYSNTIKNSVLGVSEHSLSECGAVSEEVVAEMCLGALQQANADIAIATSGIAGPGGGSDEKPVGMVCFGVVFKGKVSTSTEYFSGTRAEVRERSVAHAMRLVIEALETGNTV